MRVHEHFQAALELLHLSEHLFGHSFAVVILDLASEQVRKAWESQKSDYATDGEVVTGYYQEDR